MSSNASSIVRTVFALCIPLLLSCGCRGQSSSGGPPPNVLVIFGCQHSGGAMSCAGADHLETPHLDRLADDGVLFANAYTANPVCMPARVSLMTGRMASTLGMNHNGAVDTVSADPALGELMQDAGYETAWIGKSHLPPLTNQGLETFLPFNHDDARAVRESIKYIQKERDRPFFLVANFTRTHDLCEYARKLGDYPERTQLPQGELEKPPPEDQLPPLPDNFQIPEQEPTVLREIVIPADPPAYPIADADKRIWRELRWAYGQLTEQMDASMGDLLQFLRDNDLYDDMFIIYLAGHGDGHGEHQWNQKQVLYDAVANVPFIVKPPRGSGDIGRVDRSNVVSATLDLMPTVADYAGGKTPEELHGRSVRPLIENPDSEAGHVFVVTETTFGTFKGDHGVSGRMVRTPQYKYIVYNKGGDREQLFDMIEDPGETVDLTVRPEYEEVLSKHRRYLRQWIRKTGDFFDRVPTETDTNDY